MRFLWPALLFLWLTIPALLGAYFWIMKRKKKFAVRYASLDLVRSALPRWHPLRRHLPFALMLIGLVLLIGAVARPAAVVKVPLNRTTIILALDSSRSMCATDIFPNRLTVAQDAALAFIADQPEGTQIGIVAFSDFAELVVPPTQDKKALAASVRSLTTAFGTAIGSATLEAIDAIATINDDVRPSAIRLDPPEGADLFGEGRYNPDIIVLLTDGANTRGPLPLDAAQQAAERGLRVYTIGFGTTQPSNIVCNEMQIGSDTFNRGFGGFGGLGGFGGSAAFNFPQYLRLDEPTLQAIAEITGGTYFRAESAEQLFNVFLNLPQSFVLQEQDLEISFLFLGLAGLLAFAAIWLSLRWNRFP